MATKPPPAATPTKEAPKGKPGDKAPVIEENLIPSALDERTHAELLNLVEESSRAILFAKAQQWRTVGSTLLVFLVMVALSRYVSDNPRYVSALEIVIFMATPAAILILVMYQFWQHTELTKLQAVGMNLSNLYRRIRRIKSGREANIHRYVIFLFMVGIILMAAGLALYSFAPLR